MLVWNTIEGALWRGSSVYSVCQVLQHFSCGNVGFNPGHIIWFSESLCNMYSLVQSQEQVQFGCDPQTKTNKQMKCMELGVAPEHSWVCFPNPPKDTVHHEEPGRTDYSVGVERTVCHRDRVEAAEQAGLRKGFFGLLFGPVLGFLFLGG